MRTVLVTGASGGIGKAVAKAFIKNGDRVIAHYNKNKPDLDCHLLKADFSEFNASLFSSLSVDVLVNNAAVSEIALFTELEDEKRKNLYNINLMAHINLTKTLLPYMISKKSGSIINITSMWGQVGASCEVDYSTSKAGLIGFTKALSKELAPSGITVNAISPGIIETNMLSSFSKEELSKMAEEIPLGRLGKPEDIAPLAVFLASSSAKYITGQIIGVNGGYVV